MTVQELPSGDGGTRAGSVMRHAPGTDNPAPSASAGGLSGPTCRSCGRDALVTWDGRCGYCPAWVCKRFGCRRYGVDFAGQLCIQHAKQLSVRP